MKVPKMKRTPSALKWMAEKRGRLAGALQACEQIHESLSADLKELQQKLEVSEAMLASAETRRQRIKVDLAAMDQAVQLFDEGIDPANIQAINGWEGTYGKRGALRGFLMHLLQSNVPNFLLTTELAIRAQTEFCLVFEHNDARYRWHRNSLRGALKILARQGLVERGPDEGFGHNDPGSWRWTPDAPKTLASLRTT